MNKKIKDLEWQIKELTNTQNLWYKQCKEYELILLNMEYDFKIK